MKKLFAKFVRICPKSGEFKGFRKTEGIYKVLFPVIGFAALIWVVYRVSTKPSRLSYPCVKAAMPFASGFLGYVFIFLVGTAAFIKSKKKLFTSPVFYIAAFLLSGLMGAYVFENSTVVLTKNAIVEANAPMGEAVGIFPGRVVWVHNPDATNENCTPDAVDHGWFMPENNDQEVIDIMVSSAIQKLTGEATDSASWDAVFKFHNNTVRAKGQVGYVSGEKIFIKTNATSSWGGNFSTKTLAKTNNQYYGISETSPGVVLSVLKQLVNVVGVAETDIYIGDPMKHIYKHDYDYWHSEFPGVHYLDHDGYTNLGREKIATGGSATIHYSDNGAILRPNVWSVASTGSEDTVYGDDLYKIFEDAEYMINIPMLKGHKRAGVTMFAKNHFGSHTRGDASHLHNGLIAPTEMENGIPRAGYGLYRVQVDIMSSKYLGKKNLLYLMDALWATDHELGTPLKWQMAPFNDDWMSSVFASLDPVAIESVGYDFLRSEYTIERGAGTYAQMDGVDDYLHQAADSANWPEGIKYDPDCTGVLFASLGVHEHWNNAADMEYTRNLGTGDGIELLKVDNIVSVENSQNEIVSGYSLTQNYPNPFNPATKISYTLPEASEISLKVFDILGKEITTLYSGKQNAGKHTIDFKPENLSSGTYIYRLETNKNVISKKMMFIK